MKRFFLNIFLMVFIMGSISFANSIKIEGIVKVKGSVPHTYIVIEDSKSKKDYKVANANIFNLEKIQNQRVVAEANIIKEALGATFPAVIKIDKLTIK